MKILIVDDDHLSQVMFKKFISDMGYEGVTSNDGRSALEEFKRAEGYPLILTDLFMPVMDGFKFCKEIRKLPNGHMPVILAVTSHLNPKTLEKALSAGADDYLDKPNLSNKADARILRIRLQVATRLVNARQKHYQAEQSKEKNKQRFKDLANLLPQIVFETNLDGTFTFLNRWALENHKFGYTYEDFENGLNVIQMIIPEQRDQAIINFKRRLLGKGEDFHEYTVLKKNGERAPVEVYATPIYHHEKALGLRGIVVDISARKTAEDARRNSEERYRKVFQTANDAIFLMDNGIFIDCNTKTLDMFACRRKDIIGKPPGDFSPPLQPDGQKSTEKATGKIQAAQNGLPQFFYWKHRRLDGSLFDAEISLNNLKIDNKLHILAIVRDITWRMETEENLRKSEERYHAIFDHSPIGLFHYNTSLKILECNNRFVEILESTKKSLVGLDMHQLNDTRVLPAISNILSNIEGFYEGEYKATTSSTQIFISLRTTPLTDEKGQVNGGIGIVEDITSRKLAEKELRILSTAMIQSPSLVVITDINSKILYVNPKFTRLTGYTLEEVKGRDAHILKTNRQSSEFHKNMWNTITSGKEWSGEFCNQKKNGEFYWEVAAISPIRDEKNNITHFLKVAEDITERKKSEEKIRHLNAVLSAIRNVNQVIVREKDPQKIIQNTCDNLIETRGFLAAWIVVIDEKGKIIRAAESGLGEKFFDFIENFKQNQLPYCAPNALSSKKAFITLASDTRCIECPFSPDYIQHEKISVSLTYNEKIYGILTVYLPQDLIADDKELDLLEEIAGDIGFALNKIDLETEKIDIQNQLVQSQKMEAVGKLAGGVAHDFNNLLQAISLYTELLLMDIEKSDPLYHNVEEIVNLTERAASLTRQLLAFSRRQMLKLDTIDVNDILKNLSKMLNRLIGEDIELITKLDPEAKIIQGDTGQIEQIILNLVVNARDAIQDGGTITITVRSVHIDEFVTQTTPNSRQGDFVCITVEDTGIGMNGETLNQIFEPFFSTKGGRGTGLGLSTVYGIVKQHNGWINVYSEPGCGAKFNVFLPVSDKEKIDFSDNSSIDDYHGNGERILFVEDDEIIRKATQNMLTQKGYTVFSAETTQEALTLFQKENKNFDIVLSDVVLPDESGLVLVSRILSIAPDMPIILNSGYTEQKSHWASIKEMGIHFLQKPYSLLKLLKTIDEILKSE